MFCSSMMAIITTTTNTNNLIIITIIIINTIIKKDSKKQISNWRVTMHHSAKAANRFLRLCAGVHFQNSLGMQDLGQFFHRPIRAANGSLLLTLVNMVRDTKFVGLGSAKWVLLSKLARRQSLPSIDIGDAHNMLIASIPVS